MSPMQGTQFHLVDGLLLEKIDRLFACNAGDYVDLPQIVVVGHQSSGKSSVLVGLTGLPFPRDSELCTRFATQITFRRSNESKKSAWIVPVSNSSKERREKMSNWGKRDLESLDADAFAAIIVEVAELMDVGPTRGQTGSAFAEDVLVLEIAGPNEEHFSVIDVPGMFRRTTAGSTTKDDIALVEKMVNGYMVNPRSVMLVVVPCNVDIANQEIVELAEDLDPDGDRTLGVLTKPDLVDRGAENAVVDLINNKRHQLKLGWHLLRNPGQAELVDKTKARSEIENAFFTKEEPWNKLDKGKIGIESLKSRLQEILAAHIRREFPKVKAEIHEKLQASEKRLEVFGPKRQTPGEQLQFLMDIALRFQDVTESASRANYGQSDFFQKDENFCLATASVNRGESFSNAMAKFGHEFDFQDSDEDGPISELDLKTLTSDESKKVPTRGFDDLPMIRDILSENTAINLPHHDNILGWLKSVYRKSRGFELGTFDSSLLLVTMQHQAKKWHNLARGYISDIIVLVHSFLTHLLRHIVPNERVRNGLESLLIDGLRERYRAALDQTEFLLKVELGGTPATYNRYFNDTLNTGRQERLQQQISKKAFSGCSHGNVVHLSQISQIHPLSNDDHIIREIQDILRSYYKLARKRFVDNVRMQAADHYLVTGPETPLKLLSPKFVAKMTAPQLEDIVGEEAGLRRRRAELDNEIQLLKEGIKILQH